MKGHRTAAAMAIILGFALVEGTGSPALAGGNEAFGFNAPLVSGFPGGRSAEITGGGAYNLPDFVHSGAAFVASRTSPPGPSTDAWPDRESLGYSHAADGPSERL